MKRNKFFIQTRHIYLALTVLAVSLLSSCLKDNGPGSVNFGDSPALVGFQYTGFAKTTMITKILGKSTDATDVEVALSVSTVTLKSPVTVTIQEDPTGEANYIAADTAADGTSNGSHVLPTSLYTTGSTNLTISPGQQIIKFHIAFKGNLIDFSQNYILGFKLVNAQGATLASNLSSIVLKILLKSIYEGAYTNNGTFVDNAGATTDGVYPEKIDLLTAGQYVVDFSDVSFNIGYGHPIYLGGLSYFGSFDPEFTIDPATGKVTGVTNAYGQNSGPHARSAVLEPSGINAISGTPGTPGFTISVKYTMTQAGVPRTTFTEVYTFTGAL